MADDSVVAAASASEHAPSRRPQNKKIEGKGSCRGKRTRSESNLGLKPTNKRKKGVGSTDVAEVDIDNTGAGVDNDEVEALQQEKQRLLTELRRYTVLGDASADTPPPPHTSLSRRNSQTSLVGAPPSSSPAALPSSSTDPMNPTSSFRHWDFLLQEMQWMSTDFAQERKWRIRKAKTLSLSVTSYHGKKSTAAMRTLQHEEQARKRFAAKMGRDVKKFWLKVDKLVAHQVKAAEDSRRKASMETQLQFLLQQTEKYASALATTFAMADAMMHDANNQISYDEEGSDFSEVEEPADDESTIEAEEQLQSKADVAMEVALLQEESTMSIQALHAKYAAIMEEGEEEEEGEDGDDLAWNKDVTPAINLDEKTRIQTRGQAEGTESDGDFEMDDIEEAADDESTIEAEEQFQSKADVDMEVQLLQEESTLSIEALRAKYAAIMDEEEEEDMHGTTTLAQTAPVETSRTKRATSKRMSDMVPLTDDANDVWTQVGLERPFLLHHTLHLRAYQATGVAWLLSLAHNRMNGILADEMGLGKTIQTISLLAALATEGLWGPHLVIVPTSCILNWEMEFKRWCPGFKVMTYYGSAKRRKELGWSKVNAFQVCITSYQLVVADAPCFKRKKWYYLILDEAHNIKNWKSQRWQTLLTFNTQRRLLLTGTPLQNNLMELWALMHFLMPHLFRSRAQFSHWFSTPMNAMVEGEAAVNDQLVSRLHNIIRPFVLRRLKKDVAKQMV
ncbi:hypothetical protein B5M09_010086 [Aphanomyces astaci]|uniref:Helicase ATP-binding domain-containing protein n=1 Tax=Aphanomyces astaci TaxID=112090 RepID=A0A3R7Y3E3_APHAT|nr:hypothetical protein B5M09_010086 [Aphanomyces astaci]